MKLLSISLISLLVIMQPAFARGGGNAGRGGGHDVAPKTVVSDTKPTNDNTVSSCEVNNTCASDRSSTSHR